MTDRTTLYFKIRAGMVFVFLVLCLGFIAMRAYKLQVLERGTYLSVAQQQYYSRRINLAPHRGTIYDATGRELAVSMRVNSLYAQPAKIKDKGDAAARLAPILNSNASALLRRLSSPKSFVWLQRKINPVQQEKIKALHLQGVDFIPESRRFYPNFELGAHLIGFAGMDSQGLEGLERAYDKYLKTANTYVVLERDALGRWIYIPESKHGVTAPHDLHLTIDLRIQYIAERELKRGLHAQKARGGMVVIMEPTTGKIRAMAVHPSFNPNLFTEYQPDRWRNRIITDPFEPGSLLKIFLLAAVLQEEIKETKDIVFCENGAYKVPGHTIHDINSHGWLTVKDVIRYSSNIGAYKIGKELGAVKFYSHLDAFGFTEVTGIDLLGEDTGKIRPPTDWSPVDLSIISFGQGVSVTALQLITALSCIANGGDLLKPYLVERITDENGKSVAAFSPEVRRRVLSTELCNRTTAVLKEVVRTGTGTRAQVPGYEVAGKTATSQKIDRGTGSYSKERVIASFMGYLPADNPRVAILAVVDEPQRVPYGGTAAAPIFQRIAEELLHYMRIPPTTGGDGDGELIVAQTPQAKKGEAREKRQASQPGMPDLRGLNMRRALTRLEQKQVRIKLAGSGIVTGQQPNPGDPLPEGSTVFLQCAPPR
jgi:cell division protein FtsI (penicillin-binding protein 3)